MRIFYALLGASLCDTPAVAQPARPAARVISVDVRQAKGPLARPFGFCVGAGRANEGLRADWQQQLAQAKRECGFRYLRLHGLLHDDMGVYSEDRQGNPVYNWQYVDKLYDFLLSIKVRPFVELSFMPSALRSTDQAIFWWKANVSPPKDYAKWQSLITALLRHWEQRYGRQEVASWYFEVWNEPNYPAFFAGSQAEYFKLYAATARAVKSVSASYRVGGPASSGTGWIDETLAYCAQNQVPLDFISTHDYGVTEGGLDEFGQGQQKLGDPDGIARHVAAVRAKIRVSALPKLELHITEWNTSYSPRDPVHDAYQSAAYILHTLKQTETTATSMAYWTFTDIFEEAGVPPTPFHGGFGLLNLQGIKKPAYFAYQYLHQLGPTELPTTDAASWVTRDAAGNVQVLLWNFTAPAQGAATNQVYFRQEHPVAPAQAVRLALRGLRPGAYTLEVQRVGYNQHDAYSAYLRQGSPAYLTPAQVQALQAPAASPAPLASRRLAAGATLTQMLDLHENEVLLLRVQRR
jgi:xylan 1,4-beta-xylosidase